ncbi:OmpP1/FadL family transporter [Methylophaga sp. OBS1]|uniref:OmpP1/FadL family transporter n=1 Tax=Methylophaga sp. OBS1 TaxID=2991933 RepID=UPI00224F0003|nr:porin [Methylophaga sp. OBS1]MCX4190999.1 outer membrane protein transport protein [Methylophaga sp. OBS1]MCX4192055.1 outer membrane protein transport protein [Methylophaga sp. OBS1]
MNSKLKNISAFVLIAALPGTVSAAGFAIKEQSITSLGRAFAGSAAVAEDASTIFFNPAGLTYLDRSELDLGLNYIKPQSEFRDEGSTINGNPLTGGDGGDAGNDAFVPNFYLSHPVNDKVTLGFGVSAPFGLVTEYKDDWVGRYLAVKSEMLTLNFNPTLAIQATEKLSLGFGVSAQYIDVKLTKVAQVPADAGVELEGDDWGYGYNLGLLYQFTDQTRVGLSYRSKISHTLEGDGTLDALGVKEDISADLDLPETVSLAIHHQLNDKWAIMADATWTRWSRFEELVIESDGILSTDKPENWDNSMRYGIGLSYQYNDKWQFRTGVAYDETPIPSSGFRTARIPGNDRKWVAFGASYQYSDNIVIDAAYAHLFMDDPRINESESIYNLRGKYDASVDIVGLQLRWLM